ncbi:uncharacterized protein LOC107045990 [Diachasma alloeum]|uniref:uncharacterized protein LOC107045990 n=1 Tax=Diachasma alloeum TaxID=454923 RepID=UPI0007383412|nr:uncharacterized protein LOC107045990 [Diachasma alloeum]
MQPLDVSVFGPLKTAFRRESDTLLEEMKGKRITFNEIAFVFRKAYVSVATMENGISGFKASGIFPFNRHTCNEEDFMPAEMLNRLDRQQNINGGKPSLESASSVSSQLVSGLSELQTLLNPSGTLLSALNCTEDEILNLDIPVLNRDVSGVNVIHTQPPTAGQKDTDDVPVQDESSQISGYSKKYISPEDSPDLRGNSLPTSEPPKEFEAQHVDLLGTNVQEYNNPLLTEITYNQLLEGSEVNNNLDKSRHPAKNREPTHGEGSPDFADCTSCTKEAIGQPHESSESNRGSSILPEISRNRRPIQHSRLRSNSSPPSSRINTQTDQQIPIIKRVTPSSSSSCLVSSLSELSERMQASTFTTPTTIPPLTTLCPRSSPTSVPNQSTPFSHLVEKLFPPQVPPPSALSSSGLSWNSSTPQIVIMNMSSKPSETVPLMEKAHVDTPPVKKGSKKQHSTILTDSSMKEILEIKHQNRIETDQKSRQRAKRALVKKEKKCSPIEKKRRVKKLSPPKKPKVPKKTLDRNKKVRKVRQKTSMIKGMLFALCVRNSEKKKCGTGTGCVENGTMLHVFQL